jgi:hypothetical protein
MPRARSEFAEKGSNSGRFRATFPVRFQRFQPGSCYTSIDLTGWMERFAGAHKGITVGRFGVPPLARASRKAEHALGAGRGLPQGEARGQTAGVGLPCYLGTRDLKQQSLPARLSTPTCG